MIQTNCIQIWTEAYDMTIFCVVCFQPFKDSLSVLEYTSTFIKNNVMHDDFQLPGEEGSSLRWQVNENRRVHVYERCSQFSILQSLPTAYMWASPMPQRALEQYHLVLKKCPAQNQRMRDVLVYPDKGGLRPEEEKFIELLRRQAALTVK